MSDLLIVAGYGGHAGYALAVLHELSRLGYRDSTILLAEGTDYFIDRMKRYGHVETAILPRRPGEPLIKTVFRWPRSLIQSIKIVSEKKKVCAVFATGSNFSLLPSFIAKISRGSNIYTIEAIERFRKPSRAVKILSTFGAKVFLHWEEQKEMYPKGEVVGPVYEPRIYEPREEGYVLVTTGTLGYPQLYKCLERLQLKEVVIQTGDIDPEPIASRNPSWKVFRYTNDIHRWISGANVVITHQGITASISALAYRKPTIVVWNPRVSLGAKREDVKRYADKIGSLFLDRLELDKMKEALEKVGHPRVEYPNGAETIARILLRVED